MTRKQVFITRKIHTSALNRLQDDFDVEVWQEETPPPNEVLLDRISHVDGILSMLTDPISREVIANAGSHFQVISQMAVGFDNIDIDEATRRHIPVGHTPGVLTETCADFTWALLMAISRRVVEADRQVHEGIWKPWGPHILTGPDIYGATLGIIGFGRIGQAVARRARGFNMRVLYNDMKTHPDLEDELGVIAASLPDLLAQSDIISLHVYLSPTTRGMFNRDLFGRVKKGAIFINTARGPIVDSDALVWALQEGLLSAAALDVFDPEPIPAKHPLLSMPNVIITPHIASASIQTRERMAHIAVDNLLAGMEQRRLTYCANPQVYYP